MNKPRLLVVGNHTCGNRGDAAIIRGLLHGIERQYPDAEVTVTSRYPTSSAFLLNRPVDPDLFDDPKLIPSGPRQQIKRVQLPWGLLAASRSTNRHYRKLLPAAVESRIEHIRNYDAVIQCGGSYFVDLYGTGHFETAFATFIAQRPLIMIGHSIGPITHNNYPIFIRHLLERARYVGLRETISRNMLAAAGMPMSHIAMGADTAWNVLPVNTSQANPRARFFGNDTRPIVAITTRILAPFDRLLGVNQTQYESAFGELIKRLIANGYNVLALSTCTGIDSYHRDDRMVAWRIGIQIGHPDRYQVLMDEVDDLELGATMAACDLVIATRLHSAIIAMNFGTPALTLNYEHKSAGTLNDMGLSRMHLDIATLIKGEAATYALEMLDDIDTWRERIRPAVENARQRAQKLITDGLSTAF